METPQVPQPPQPEKKLGFPLLVVSFCIPIVGLILFLVKREKEPQAAKQAGVAAAWGFVIGIVANVIMTLLR